MTNQARGAGRTDSLDHYCRGIRKPVQKKVRKPAQDLRQDRKDRFLEIEEDLAKARPAFLELE